MIRIAHIAAAAERVLHLPENAIGATDRVKPWARGRQIVMWIACRRLGHTPSQTGHVLGRNFATVIHGVRKIDELLKRDPELSETIEAIEELAHRIASTPAGARIMLRRGAPLARDRRLPAPQLSERFPPEGLAPAAHHSRIGSREWFEHNDRRFVAAMRAVYPDLETNRRQQWA